MSKGNVVWMVSSTQSSSWKAKNKQTADAHSADPLLKSGRGMILERRKVHYDKMHQWLHPSAPVCSCEKPTGDE